ncbi:MAG TPA: VOC family protein [Roseateles sp.]|nr:VOC family protein [Roseateles sp.]HWT54753.1 VOC family protein [Rhodocyclaceae bacterium]
MQTPISWFEIPALNFERARHFYEHTFDVELHIEEKPEFQMGIFPHPDGQAGGCITGGKGYAPAAGGVVVYLYAGDDLSKPLERAVSLGGKVVMAKTSIGEHGYIALFRDSEGNTVGLHSMN